MLNELKEFEQYTMGVDAFKNPADRRLKYGTFVKKPLSGLERAMTIIARWYIFKNDNAVQNFNEDDVKEVLKAWCGFEIKKDVLGDSPVNGWLNRYIRCLFLQEALCVFNKKIDSLPLDTSGRTELMEALKEININDDAGKLCDNNVILEQTVKNLFDPEIAKAIKNNLSEIKLIVNLLDKLNNKNKYFSRSVYSIDYKKDNDYKAITYERIIANAFHLGKLKQYYLLCITDPFEKDFIKKQTKTKTKMLDSDKDLILRITALYLLQKLNTVQEYVYFNQTDLANWLLKKADPDKFELKKYKFTTVDEPIFNIVTINGNVTKLKIHSKWVEMFKLVEADDIDKPENRGLIFYSDEGSGYYLQRNHRY